MAKPDATTAQPETPTAEPLATERAIASMLGVRRETLAVWRHRKMGPPFVQLGPRTPRYRVADVEAWLKAKSAGGV